MTAVNVLTLSEMAAVRVKVQSERRGPLVVVRPYLDTNYSYKWRKERMHQEN